MEVVDTLTFENTFTVGRADVITLMVFFTAIVTPPVSNLTFTVPKSVVTCLARDSVAVVRALLVARTPVKASKGSMGSDTSSVSSSHAEGSHKDNC